MKLLPLVMLFALTVPANAGEEIVYENVGGWTVTALNPGSKFGGCAMPRIGPDGELKF